MPDTPKRTPSADGSVRLQTEPLRNLLRAALPGPYYVDWDEDRRIAIWAPDGRGKHLPIATMLHPNDNTTNLMAFAPELALEVLRLRELVDLYKVALHGSQVAHEEMTSDVRRAMQVLHAALMDWGADGGEE